MSSRQTWQQSGAVAGAAHGPAEVSAGSLRCLLGPHLQQRANNCILTLVDATAPIQDEHLCAMTPTWWQWLCLGQCSAHWRWSIHSQVAQQCQERCSCLSVLTMAVQSAHIQALADACKHRQNMPAALLQCLRLQAELCEHGAEQTAACRLRLPATKTKVNRHKEQHLKGCKMVELAAPAC